MKKEQAHNEQESAEKEPVEATEEATSPEEASAETEQPQEPDNAAELQKQVDELNDRLMRSAAEFDNFRKRTAREKSELYQDATIKCVQQLLPVLDNFERALETETQDEEFRKGVEMILRQLEDAFKQLGVTEMEALNQPFDPMRHNAVNQVEDESFGKNTVCQVFQKGYLLGDKVVRYAMVVVANP